MPRTKKSDETPRNGKLKTLEGRFIETAKMIDGELYLTLSSRMKGPSITIRISGRTEVNWVNEEELESYVLVNESFQEERTITEEYFTPITK